MNVCLNDDCYLLIVKIDIIRRILSGGYLLKTYTANISLKSEIGIIYVLGVDFPHYTADETLLRRKIADNIL